MNIQVESYLYEIIYYLPVITLCMSSANGFNPDEDEQNVNLVLDPNCLTL